MSQFFVNSSGGGGGGSSINEIDTQNGNAQPIANVVILDGFDSTINNSNGIATRGGIVGTGVQNEVDVILTNRFHGSATTIGATTSDVITFSLGATPACFFFNFSVTLFNASTPAGAGYSTYTTVRTDGASATIIGDTDAIVHEDAALIATTAQIVVSGNNVIFRVGGVAGLTIDWVLVGNYIEAT